MTQENWREELKNEIFPIGIWHDSLPGYERRLELMEAFIETLVARVIQAIRPEIENENNQEATAWAAYKRTQLRSEFGIKEGM